MTAPGDPDLVAEIRLLRAEVAAFTGKQDPDAAERKRVLADVTDLGKDVGTLRQRVDQLNAVKLPRRMWPRVIIRDLEVNPQAQYRVHIAAMWFWVGMTAAVTIVFFGLPAVWLRVSIFYVVLISHYANFATDYGGATSALAAIHARAAEKNRERS